jgi:hypothetical protein
MGPRSGAWLLNSQDGRVMNMTKWLAVLCVMAAGVSEAQAQAIQWEDRGYLSLNFGVQPQSRDFTELSTPEIYGENASITVPHTIGSGAFTDLGAGMRLYRNGGVFLGFSRFSKTESPTIAAQIPHPFASNSLRPASASAGELSHSETAVHLHLFWMIPLTEEFEAALFVGPSFYNIKQEFIESVTLQEGAVPFGTVSITEVRQIEQSKRATAFTAGVDGTYLLTPRFGAGAFLRYSGASVDMPLAGGGTVTVEAGGFQLGGGLRVRF